MYSFDVFDTLITRRVKNPKGIFSVMAYKLIKNSGCWDIPVCCMADFEMLRINAEEQARRQSEGEVTIDLIYQALAHNYGLSEDTADRLKLLEIQCEIENCIAIRENIDKIESLRRQGEKVILISDMYLSKSVFERMFQKVSPMLNNLPIYISSETGKTKASGLLYQYIHDRERVEYGKWTHIGDNIVSDVNIPETFGINAVHYKAENASICEKRLEQISIENTIIREYLFGLLNGDALKGKSREYLIGYSFIGIVLYAYVEWVIRMAWNKGIAHLFFIARDGYILKNIAEDIVKSKEIKIEIHYIYGSRKAWRVTDSKKKDILRRYLKQQLNVAGEVALVDTQGTGTSIDSLGNLYGCKFKVFYYTLLEPVGDKNIDAYSYSPYAGRGMIEAFCRAPHGSTMYYKTDNDRVSPVLAELDRDVWDRSGLDEYIKGVEFFSRVFSEISTNVGGLPLLDSTADAILHYCADTPDPELADFIGDIPHDTDNSNEHYVYAPKLSRDEIYQIEMVRTTQKLEQFYHGTELLFSYKRLDPDERKELEEFQSEYYKRYEEKDDGAIGIIIYGFGQYGKELLHRAYKAANIEIKGIVDAYYQRYKEVKIPVSPIKMIKQTEFDYIVISLFDSRSAEEVRRFLTALGVSEDKIMLREDFVSEYLGEKLSE